MDTDETSDDVVRSLPGDIAHLPGGYHTEWTPPIKETTQDKVTAFLAANEDWREFARGWSGL